MTKTKQSFVTDPAQLSLFDSIKREHEDRKEKRPGRMSVAAKFSVSVKAASKAAPKSREQIAANFVMYINPIEGKHSMGLIKESETRAKQRPCLSGSATGS